MTLSTTVAIDIDDTKFQRFKELFDRYTEALKKQPEIWKKIGGIHQEHAQHFEQITQALGQQVDEQRELTDSLEKQNVALEHTDRLWTSVARQSKDVGSHILSATTSLLRWTGILGFVGSALGIGGFLGMEHLVGSVAGQRRSALGRGMSIGEQSAFGIHLGRFVDAESFMSKVAGMELDVTQRPYGLGVPFTGKTGPDAEALLRAAYYQTRSITDPGLVKPIMGALAPGMFEDDELMRFRTMQPSEFEAQMRANTKDKGALNIQEKIARDYQEADTAIKTFSASVEKSAAYALDPLAKKIPQLTDEFSKLIDGALRKFREEIEAISGMLDDIAHPGKIWDKLNAIPATNAWDMAKNSALGKTIASWFAPNKKWAAEHLDSYMARLDQHAGLPAGFIEEWRALEHSGNNAVSKAGAVGMFQFKPDAWHDFGAGGDPRDPVDAANAASRYGAQMAQVFGGDIAKMLASINVGPGGVQAAMAKAAKNGGDWTQYLPTETQAYLGRAAIYIINQTGGSAVVAGSQVGGQ